MAGRVPAREAVTNTAPLKTATLIALRTSGIRSERAPNQASAATAVATTAMA